MQLDWLHIVIRSLGAITMLFLITRLLGKKQIAQLTFFEYIAGITLGEIAGFISTDIEENYWLGVVALLTWFSVPLGVEWFTLKSKKFADIVEGKASVLITEGKILEDNMKKERLSAEELMQRLRTKNVFNVADVEFALMETSGDITVLLKKENQPITPKHLGQKLPPEPAPQAVIIDGEIINESLATLGYSRGWLHGELDKLGIPVNNIFLAQADSYGELYIDLYDDQIQLPQPNNRALLLSTLKKCQADLELFALGTNDANAKTLYSHCAETLQNTINNISPILKT